MLPPSSVVNRRSGFSNCLGSPARRQYRFQHAELCISASPSPDRTRELASQVVRSVCENAQYASCAEITFKISRRMAPVC